MALVVFLRGINVGGQRAFRPSVLARELKRYDVVNIGAAGTFVVRKRVAQATLRAELRRRLPFDADVMICKGRELINAAAKAPFADQPVRPDVIRFVSILAGRPRSAPRIPLRLPKTGAWGLKVLSVNGRFVFGVYRRQMKAIGFLGALDTLFGSRATTRSWSTVNTVIRALQAAE